MQSSAKVTQSKGSLSYRKGSHFFARVGIRAAGRPPFRRARGLRPRRRLRRSRGPPPAPPPPRGPGAPGAPPRAAAPPAGPPPRLPSPRTGPAKRACPCGTLRFAVIRPLPCRRCCRHRAGCAPAPPGGNGGTHSTAAAFPAAEPRCAAKGRNAAGPVPGPP